MRAIYFSLATVLLVVASCSEEKNLVDRSSTGGTAGTSAGGVGGAELDGSTGGAGAGGAGSTGSSGSTGGSAGSGGGAAGGGNGGAGGVGGVGGGAGAGGVGSASGSGGMGPGGAGGNSGSGTGGTADAAADASAVPCIGQTPCCGNTKIETGEDCDDGNLLSHDGCSSGCTTEFPKWEKLSATLSVHWTHVMTYFLKSGKTVLFSGYQTQDTWEWNGSKWTFLDFQPLPPSTGNARSVYDVKRDRMVMYGGAEKVATTWALSKNAWTDVSPPAGPGGRQFCALAYDIDRDRIVMFGGGTYTEYFDDTWEYDGTSWQQATVTGKPEKRQGIRGEYDRSRKRVVVFGGWNGSLPKTYSDLWEYDGKAWTKAAPSAAPPARAWYSTAYDPRRKRFVLGGGSHPQTNQELHDLWEWDGKAWANITPAVTPGRIVNTPFIYDEQRGHILLETEIGTMWKFSWQSAWPDETCQPSSDSDKDGLSHCADPDCDAHPSCLK